MSVIENYNRLLQISSRPVSIFFNGYNNPRGIDESYDPVGRRIKLVGRFGFFYRARQILAVEDREWLSPQHDPNPVTPLYLYYNDDGQGFRWSTEPYNTLDAPVAYVQYDDAGEFEFALRACHGTMHPLSHQAVSRLLGGYLKEGGDLTNFVLDSTTPADRRPTIEQYLLVNTDIESEYPTYTPTDYTWVHLEGSLDNPDVVFTENQTDMVYTVGGVPHVNEVDENDDTWKRIPLTGSEYVNVFQIAIPVTSDAKSLESRMFWLMGQVSSALKFLVVREEVRDLQFSKFLNISNHTYCYMNRITLRKQGSDWVINQVDKLSGVRALP